jgi:hypothetical protein
MEDGGGHQMAHIEYPGLPTDYVMEMVHKLLRRVLLPAQGRVPRGLEGDRQSRCARLYVEAKAFLKLRAQRNKMVKRRARRSQKDPPPSSTPSPPTPIEQEVAQ